MTKQLERIARFCQSERVPLWGKRLYSKLLKTDTEKAACAIACRYRELLPLAQSVIERIEDPEALLHIAASDARTEVRMAAFERLPKERDYLLAVKAAAKHWSRETASLYPVETKAVALLREQEEKAISAATDEATLLRLLLDREVTESAWDVVVRINSEDALLSLLTANVDYTVTQAVLKRAQQEDQPCGDAFQNAVLEMSLSGELKGSEYAVTRVLGDPAHLIAILAQSRDADLSREAASTLCWLYDRKTQSVPPLTDTQQDVLVRHLAAQSTICRNLALGLLDAAHLKSLYGMLDEHRSADKLEIVRRLPQSAINDELMNDLLKMGRGRSRDEWERRLSAFPTEKLIEIVKQHPDWTYRVFALELAVKRLQKNGDNPAIDALVLPVLDEIRTENGHIGSKLVDVFRALPEPLQAHFGFSPEYEEGETIDDAEWSTLKVGYEGHLYWVYYSQTDGGGYCPPYGQQIR